MRSSRRVSFRSYLFLSLCLLFIFQRYELLTLQVVVCYKIFTRRYLTPPVCDHLPYIFMRKHRRGVPSLHRRGGKVGGANTLPLLCSDTDRGSPAVQGGGCILFFQPLRSSTTSPIFSCENTGEESPPLHRRGGANKGLKGRWSTPMGYGIG